MTHKYLNLLATPGVKDAQTRYGSRHVYQKRDGSLATSDEPVTSDRIDEAAAQFIAARDSFYMASVSEAGWPYVQYRGGLAGFLKVLAPKQLGYADFRGNRQYISIGNFAGNDRVALFFMDYPNQRRLKLLGRVRIVEAGDDPDLIASLHMPGYKGVVERAIMIDVEALDWNCPQHITPRFTEAELAAALHPVSQRIAELEAENAELKAFLAKS